MIGKQEEAIMSNTKKVTQYDATGVVNALIGPINPIGETNEDDCRLANLDQLGDVLNDLSRELWLLASREKDGRASVDRAIDAARMMMAGIGEWYVLEDVEDAES